LQETGHIKNIAYKLSPAKINDNLELKISTNVTDWETLPPKEDKEVVQASVKQALKYIRVINKSIETTEARIKEFTISLR